MKRSERQCRRKYPLGALVKYPSNWWKGVRPGCQQPGIVIDYSLDLGAPSLVVFANGEVTEWPIEKRIKVLSKHYCKM